MATHEEQKAALCSEILRLQEQNRRLSQKLESSAQSGVTSESAAVTSTNEALTEKPNSTKETVAEDVEVMEKSKKETHLVFNQLQAIQKELLESQTKLVEAKRQKGWRASGRRS